MTPAELLRESHISHSKLTTFDQCRFRFKLQYLDQLPQQPSYALQLGKFVHEVLAIHLRDVQQQSTTVPTELSRLESIAGSLKEKWTQTGDLATELEKDVVAQLLGGFVGQFPTVNGKRIAAVEATKITQVGKWTVKSVLDLILSGPNGQQIVDFKTGKSQYVTEHQLQTYSLAIFAEKDCQSIDLSYVFLKEGHSRDFRIEAREVKGVQSRITAQADVIAAETVFEANPTKLCHWCSFRHACPTYEAVGQYL